MTSTKEARKFLVTGVSHADEEAMRKRTYVEGYTAHALDVLRYHDYERRHHLACLILILVEHSRSILCLIPPVTLRRTYIRYLVS